MVLHHAGGAHLACLHATPADACWRKSSAAQPYDMDGRCGTYQAADLPRVDAGAAKALRRAGGGGRRRFEGVQDVAERLSRGHQAAEHRICRHPCITVHQGSLSAFEKGPHQI